MKKKRNEILRKVTKSSVLLINDTLSEQKFHELQSDLINKKRTKIE